MIRWDYWHANNENDWSIRYSGILLGSGPPPVTCCFLLLSGPADELLLLGSGCLKLLSC